MTVRQISAMQAKRSLRKGCKGNLIHVTEAAEESCIEADHLPLIKELEDVFPEELPGLPPTQEVN